jgi:hypothetical protein
MDTSRRKPQIPSGTIIPEPVGQVVAILPAHCGSNAESLTSGLSRELAESYRLPVLLAEFSNHGFPLLGLGASAAPSQRLDNRTPGAFLRRSGGAFDTLEARDAHPRNIQRLLECARERYSLTCADLSEARESAALEVLANSDSIFLAGNSDPLSLEMARHRAEWLRSLGLAERAALLLKRVPGGLSGADAEDLTGLPVCAILDSGEELRSLAKWIAGPVLPRHAGPLPIRLVG